MPDADVDDDGEEGPPYKDIMNVRPKKMPHTTLQNF